MKINLIIFISEFNLGGAGNSLFKLCKNLPKNKFEITVICLNKCFYKSRLNKLNIRVYEVNSNKTILGDYLEKYNQYKFYFSCTITIDKFTSEPLPQIIIRDIMKID